MQVSPKAVYALNQHLIHHAISPITRIHGSCNQGLEMGVARHTIIPINPLAKFLLLLPKTTYSAGLEVLFPKGGRLPPEDTTINPLN